MNLKNGRKKILTTLENLNLESMTAKKLKLTFFDAVTHE